MCLSHILSRLTRSESYLDKLYKVREKAWRNGEHPPMELDENLDYHGKKFKTTRKLVEFVKKEVKMKLFLEEGYF
jgi:hypothetical protein